MLSCAACAIVAVRKLKLNSSSTVVLSTAHPAKFEEAVALALENFIPPLPAALAELYTLQLTVLYSWNPRSPHKEERYWVHRTALIATTIWLW
jgi:threonine synthase